MKNFNILFFLLVFIANSNKLYSQNWQWAKHAGGASEDAISTICTDFFDNLYVFGTYGFGYMTFPAASINFDSISLQPNGDNQLFVVKYSSLGNVLWAKSIGGNNIIGNSNIYESPRSITYDIINQCIYITGNIFGTATFGNTTLSGYGVSFYAKMDLNGNFIWAKQLPFVNSSYLSITSDNQGHQMIYGYISDSIQLGPSILPSGGFLAKFNSNGDVIWAKNYTSNYTFSKLKLYNNNILGIINIANDSIRINSNWIVSNYSKNSLVVSLDSVGSLNWYKTASSNNSIKYFDMDIDIFGNVIIVGNFVSNAIFSSTQLTNTNTSDILIVKYDSNGLFNWLKQGNCSNSIAGNFVNASNGDIYISGSLIGNVILDTISVTSTINAERFISKWTTNGSIIGVQLLNISNHSRIFLSDQNHFFITGDFYQSLSIGTSTLNSFGYQDVFIAKYDLSTDIHENTKNKNNQLLIHANPTAGKCNITIPDDFIKEKNLVLSIYSSNGQLIQQQNLNMEEGVIKLNLEAEAKGLYNAVLTNGSKSYSGKIVFE